jgi:hypothetical protein
MLEEKQNVKGKWEQRQNRSFIKWWHFHMAAELGLRGTEVLVKFK